MDGDRLALELLREIKSACKKGRVKSPLFFYVKYVDIYIFMYYNIITLKKGDK